MLSPAAHKSMDSTDKDHPHGRAGAFATRRIWLPKALYDALPVFYLVSGIAAFLATLYISEWFWVLPHYVLFSAACIHLGLVILHRRRKLRGADRED